ncbi:N-6 DNA methylase [Dyadobacter sp. SG02]|uniref:N-6 DNA methylase n=1 Tax=Dyadobacter sp. SG02 TaxID=1855291 RepID=UPI000B8149A5|nr:N-6 DNA methylase [Dyadobacter sp. SG02]
MNKFEALESNLAAISAAFQVKKEARRPTDRELEVINQYQGWGGINEILLDPGNEQQWAGKKMRYRPYIQELHDLLQEFEPELKSEYVSSAKNSVLSSYYTPSPVVSAISKSLGSNGVEIKSFLDPSAGNGAFLSAFEQDHRISRSVSFEKDLMTGLILQSKLSDNKAIVRNEGFERAGPDLRSEFDIVTSNIPFGSIPVYDPEFARKGKVEAASTKYIHNYFLLKSIDLVKPGGLIAIITTSNFADTAANEEFRTKALEQASLVSAVRLPHNLFEAAGTEAGSDLIILQRRQSPIGASSFSAHESAFCKTDEIEGIRQNLYFAANPDKIIYTSQTRGTDQYGKDTNKYHHEGGSLGVARDLEPTITEDLRLRFDEKLFNRATIHRHSINTQSASKQKPKRNHSQHSSGQLSLFDIFTAPRVREFKPDKNDSQPLPGAIVMQDGQLAKVGPKSNHGIYTLEDIYLNNSQKEKWSLLLDIKTAYSKLLVAERDRQIEDFENREILNDKYDKFVAKFGPLKNRNNIDTVLLDETFGKQLLSLEKFNQEQGVYQKTDIFSAPVHIAKNLANEKTPLEALSSSLNRFGKVDLEYIADQSRQTPNEVREALRGNIYFSPAENEFIIKDRLGSGNVVEKLENFETYLPTENKEIEESIAYLKSVIPEKIPFDELDLGLGERWVDPSVYSKFGSEFYGEKIDIVYSAAIDEFEIRRSGYSHNTKISNEFAVQASRRTYDGISLLEYAMLDTVPNITYTTTDENGNEIKVRDSEKIRLAAQKIEIIRDGFSSWATSLPDSAKFEIEKSYNRLFNSEVKPAYDGSHMQFPGLQLQNVGLESLYVSQKDASWMLLQNGGGLVDHEVGTGKTLTMIVTTHEMKRLGLAAKPMILGLKANVGAISETFRQAYPNSKVLAPTDTDFTKGKREALFSSIVNENWDAIILTHDQFSKIPQSLGVQKRIVGKELDNLEKDLEEFGRSSSVSTSLRKGLEKRKEGLRNKLNEIQDSIQAKKDDIIDFEKMGIDFLVVDESHKFKNLLFSTRHDRVAGLGNPTGSQRSLNMLFAVRTIQEKRGNDSGVIFASGTPISNSLTELYLLFKYLRPKALEKQKIDNFDSWLAVYSKKSTDYEYSVTNQLIEKSRFRQFVKVPELAAFYAQITDFRTAEMVGVDRPRAVHKLVNLPQSEQQELFNEQLIDFAKTGDGAKIGRGPLSKSEETAKMLIATNYSKKAALDMRLIYPELNDEEQTKVLTSARGIASHYNSSMHFRGTQLVFCDLGTPTGSTRDFSVYQALKDELVHKHKIPASEISFIHDAKTDKQRNKMIQDLNEGKIRITIGSTEKLGIGVNAQKLLVAMHHLDVPWKPSDFEQRVGRGARSGNLAAKIHGNNEIPNYIYAKEKTLDNFMFNLLQTKTLFIQQIKRQNISVRRIDEGGLDETNGMNFAEYVALLSGNRDLLEKAKITKQIAVLEAERKIFSNDLSSQRRAADQISSSVDSHTRITSNLTKDLDHLRSLTNNGQPDLLNGKQHIDVVGKEMLASQKRISADGKHKIGIFQNFELILRVTKDFNFSTGKDELIKKWEVKSKNGITYLHNSGNLSTDKPETAGQYINRAVNAEKIVNLIEQHNIKRKELEKNRDQLLSATNKTWPKEDRLRDLKNALQDVDRKIEMSIKAESNEPGRSKREEKNEPQSKQQVERTLIKHRL